MSVILSQNTSWINAREGFRRLKRDLPTWEKALAAPVEEVQRSIAVCGLGRMRAGRLQALLRRIKSERGRLSAGVRRADGGRRGGGVPGELPRRRPKTVACTLLFAFGMPIFPVDNGILRVVRRLGLVRAKAKDVEASGIVERATTPLMRYPLHVLTYRHAKDFCRPKNPHCDDCPLLELCPTGRRRVKHAPPPNEPVTRPRLSRSISAGLLRDGDSADRRGSR